MYQGVIEFIRQLYQKPEGFIPLHEPYFGGNEKKYVVHAIESTFVSSVGEYVSRFETMICEITGARYAIAAVNGTSALHMALLMAGVRHDDEVITQPLSFIATANAISYAQANPVFIDVDLDTLGLSPKSLEAFLISNTRQNKNNQCINKSTGRKIAACVPMHTFGFPCRIDQIVEICDAFNIRVVEDAAESLGSTYKGKHTGTFGKLGVFSLNGNKIITSGGGGCIVTDDEKIAKRAKHLTTTAKIPHAWEYNHDEIGYNYRLTNLSAALACAQLEQLAEFILKKKETSKKYKAFFSLNDEFNYLDEPTYSASNFWLNAVSLIDRSHRDLFLTETNKAGILTRPIWTLIHKMPMYAHCQVSEINNAQWLEDRVVNLPSSVIKK